MYVFLYKNRNCGIFWWHVCACCESRLPQSNNLNIPVCILFLKNNYQLIIYSPDTCDAMFFFPQFQHNFYIAWTPLSDISADPFSVETLLHFFFTDWTLCFQTWRGLVWWRYSWMCLNSTILFPWSVNAHAHCRFYIRHNPFFQCNRLLINCDMEGDTVGRVMMPFSEEDDDECIQF